MSEGAKGPRSVGAQDVNFLVWASGRLFGLPEIFNRITFPTIYIGGAYATPPPLLSGREF